MVSKRCHLPREQKKRSKKAEVIVIAPAAETEEFTLSKIEKQGMIHGPVLRNAETAQAKNGKEKVEYYYGHVKIGIPIFADDTMAARKYEHISGTIKNCGEVEMK